MDRYKALVHAQEILLKARREVFGEEAQSPAWHMLLDACEYLRKQLQEAFDESTGKVVAQ